MKLDSEIIKLFKQWQEQSGACPEVHIESVNFIKEYPFSDAENVELIGAKTLESHETLEKLKDDDGLPVFDASANILTYVSESKYPDKVFQVIDDENPDISFASEGNSSAGTNFIVHSRKYFSNNHRTVVKFKSRKYFSLYVLNSIFNMKKVYGFKRGYTPSQAELSNLKIPVLLPESNSSFEIQKIIVEFIKFHKERFDKYRQFISVLRTKVESFDKAFLPAIFSAEKDVFIVKNFNDWAEQNGYSLSFEDIAFKVGKIVTNSDSDQLVCTKRMGFTPDTTESGDMPWLTVGDLSKVDGLYIDMPITRDKTTMDLIKAKVDARGTGRSEKLIPIKKGDVLVSFKLTVGSTKIYNSDVPAYCNEAIDILTPLKGIDPSYLAYCCMIEYPKHGTKTNNGMTLNDESKSQIEIKIPQSHNKYSSEEGQKIIVKFIEAWQSWKTGMVSRMDLLENSLNQAEETLIAKVFKGAE